MPSSPNAIISLPGLRKEAGSRASAGMCQGSSGPAIKRHSASKASAHKHPAPNQLVVEVDRSASKEERVGVLEGAA